MTKNLQISPLQSPVSPLLLAPLHHTSPTSATSPSQGGICSPTGHPSRRKFNLRTETSNLVLPPPLLEHSFSGQLELQQTHCSTSMTKWSPVSPLLHAPLHHTSPHQLQPNHHIKAVSAALLTIPFPVVWTSLLLDVSVPRSPVQSQESTIPIL